jgi:propionyl-CoA carboxylase alpha chain
MDPEGRDELPDARHRAAVARSVALPRKVLIANRGEIVVRIARTCRDMGIATVAVASDPDAHGLHTRSCDEVVRLPGAAPADTYLRGDLLLEAARRSGADAVHPGFGFLAEDPRFAQAVLDAGLIWIGPAPDAIAEMGDKLAAKDRMAAAGVPLLASAQIGDDIDADSLTMLADGIGLPVIVKAAAGGGGKGMRVVHDRLDLADAVAAARREAQNAFGDARLFLERYVARPRHLEVQVLGDTHGNVVHLFERECSIQRRHQKVVEESPSPAIDGAVGDALPDDAVRDALTDAAVAAAREIGYVSAGTVEFVADESLLARRRAGEEIDPRETFAFLEMNTRLQVEHPVTEEVVRVAGQPDGRIDLVRWQVLIAAGAPLGFTQEDVTQVGHAIEVRLYAEDPAAGHLPCTGELQVFAPDLSIRWDVGVAAGEHISPHYDPMVAKAISVANTRPEAAARLAMALGRTAVAGVTTNQDLLRAIVTDDAFLAGETTTDYLDDRGDLLLAGPTEDVVDLAAACVALHGAVSRHAEGALLPDLPIGFSPTATFDPQIELLHDEPLTVRYRQRRDGRWQVAVHRVTDPDALPPLLDDPSARVAEVAPVGPDHLDVEVAGHRRRVQVAVAGTSRIVAIDGTWVRFDAAPRFPTNDESHQPGASTSPMPGKVTSVLVAVGDEVAVGAPLLTVEAMKMEHRLTAVVAGTVTEIRVTPGSQVDAGEVLVVVDGGEGSAGAGGD